MPAADGVAAVTGDARGGFRGQLRLRAARGADGVTRLADQGAGGPFHLSKPYWDADTNTLLVQVVNPTAGILSGDRLASTVTVEAGAALLLTTPSVSRVFRMRQGEATSEQQFLVAAGAWLEVWPEPLVPHTASVFTQRTRLSVEQGGGVFYCDLLLPGRIAHGECWRWQRLQLELTIEEAGRLLLRERFDHSGEELRRLAELAGAGAGAGFGNAVLILPEAVEAAPWIQRLHALQEVGFSLGASPLREPRAWSIKFIAADGDRLRRGLKQVRQLLSPLAEHLRCDPRKL